MFKLYDNTEYTMRMNSSFINVKIGSTRTYLPLHLNKNIFEIRTSSLLFAKDNIVKIVFFSGAIKHVIKQLNYLNRPIVIID